MLYAVNAKLIVLPFIADSRSRRTQLSPLESILRPRRVEATTIIIAKQIMPTRNPPICRNNALISKKILPSILKRILLISYLA